MKSPLGKPTARAQILRLKARSTLASLPPDGYDAFVSYKQEADSDVARAIRDGLHSFARPWQRLRACRVFIDVSSLAATPSLRLSLERTLDASRFLILLASPEAASSEWVNREVLYWREHKEPGHLIPVVTAGELVWSSTSADFDRGLSTAAPPALYGAFAEEPLRLKLNRGLGLEELDLRHPETRHVVAQIASLIHQRNLDELYGEDVRQHQIFRRVRMATLVALVALTITSLAFAGVAQRNASIAREQSQIAISRALAAESALKTGTDPQVGSLLSLSSLEASDTSEARAAVLNSVLYLQGQGIERFFSWPQHSMACVAISPDGRTLALSDTHGSVALWDLPSYRRIGVLPGTDNPITGVGLEEAGLAFSGDGRILAVGSSEDSRIRLWDVDSRTRIALLSTTKDGSPTGVNAGLSSVALSPNGKILIAGAVNKGDNNVFVFDVQQQKQLAALAGHSKGVQSVTFSKDGRTFVTAGFLETIVWDTSSLRQAKVIPSGANGVGISPDGNTLALGSENGVELWDLERAVKRMTLPAQGAQSVAFSPDGQYLAVAGHNPNGFLTGSSSASVSTWRISTGTRVSDRAGHSSRVNSVAFSPDGESFVTGGEDGNAIFWQVEQRTGLRHALVGRIGAIRGVAFTPDGHRLVAGGGNQGRTDEDVSTTWDLARQAAVTSLSTNSTWTEAAMRSDGRLLAAALGDGGVMLLDPSLNREQGFLPVNGGQGMAFSPDGRELAVAALSGQVTLWHAAKLDGTYTFERSLAVGEAPIAFSPDGRILAARAPHTEEKGDVLLWTADGSAELGRLHGQGDLVTDLAFSPADSNLLAVGDFDTTIALWDTKSRSQVATLSGHTASVSSISFSHDGRLLASGGYNEIILWDVRRRTSVVTLTGKVSSDSRVIFSPSDKTLAEGDDDGEIYLWDIDVASWRTYLCRITGRDFTEQERATYLSSLPSEATCG